MTANTGTASISWLSAHGRLWYDDRWYRMAWIVWPQAIGLALFAGLWLAPASAPKPASWGKPVVERPADQPAQRQIPPKPPQQTAPPLQAQQPPADVPKSCRSGNYGQTIQACSALLATGNLKGIDLANIYRDRGWTYYLNEQYQLAMSDYDRAISINPGDAGFFNDRGLIWMALENNDRAMQDYDQSILLAPNYALPYMNRGRALANLKRPNEALVAFAAAIVRDASMWLAYENRALIYEQRADWRGCYDDGNKMTQLQPNNRLGYEYRGRAYLEVGQYQPAIDDFTRAISIDSGEIYSYRLRGRAYYFLNRFDNAMADYQAALRITANDSTTISFINDLKRRQSGR